jgi:hopanoid biosynthesis associated protein HpnK
VDDERLLIVNGDDFGLSAGVNAGILRAYRDGILTAASLLVNAAGTEEAVAIAHEHPGLAVGLHLALTQARAVVAPKRIPRLVDTTGHFGGSAVLCGLRYFFAPDIREELGHEIEAQLERFHSFGLALSHVDGHMNVHLHPVVLSLLIELAPAHGITAIRLPRDPLGEALWLDPRWAPRKLAEGGVFAALSCWAAPRLRAAGIGFTDRLYGLHQTGAIDEGYLLALTSRLPRGTTELYCHPGVLPDAEVTRWMPDYQHEVELAALCSPRVRQALYDHDVRLCNHWQLRAAPAGRLEARPNPP